MRQSGSRPLRPDTLPHRRTATVIAAGTGLVLLGALAAWALLPRPGRNSPVPPVIRFSISPPASARVLDVGGPTVALTPTGSEIVYVGGPVGRSRQLYRWRLDGGEPAALPGTDNALWPFSSPDGEWVGFLSGGQLRRVSLLDGSVVTIGDAGRAPGGFRGATWTAAGEIVFATSTGFSTIPAQGGVSRPLPGTAGVEASAVAVFPDALPDGKSVLVALVSRSTAEAELAV
ncbi:MAG TPA: hypothetical protein VI383_06250, partial [Gemmatimonadales bacterium]|nr:hypothetical protein [Gemmatimonadales bacterium]